MYFPVLYFIVLNFRIHQTNDLKTSIKLGNGNTDGSNNIKETKHSERTLSRHNETSFVSEVDPIVNFTEMKYSVFERHVQTSISPPKLKSKGWFLNSNFTTKTKIKQSVFML